MTITERLVGRLIDFAKQWLHLSYPDSNDWAPQAPRRRCSAARCWWT